MDLFVDRRPSFALLVKDARNGRTLARDVTVYGDHDVASLKSQLRTLDGCVPLDAVKLHVAHGGKLLADTDLLEPLRAIPVVVLAIVRRPAPTTIVDAPVMAPATGLLQPSTPQPPAGDHPTAPRTQAPFAFALPSREEIAQTWERLFPAGNDTGQAGPSHATQQAQAPHEEEEEERLCRVCFCGEEAGRLLAPCRCRGSCKYVHVSCLNEWRVASANPHSFYRCDQCGYRYRTERTRLAEWLQSERVITAATALVLMLIVLIGALIPGPERLLYRHVRWHPAYEYAAWGWGPRCDAAVRGLLWPAAAGMALKIQEQYQLHRGLPLEQQTWAAALVVSLAGDGTIVLRPLLVGGCGYFVIHLSRRVRVECRKLFTRFGERVLELGR